MKYTDMKTPKNRSEFERNMNLVVEGIRSGRMNYPQNSIVIQSLLKVRVLPNNRMNLLTINESARLAANTANQFASMDFKNFESTDE